MPTKPVNKTIQRNIRKNKLRKIWKIMRKKVRTPSSSLSRMVERLRYEAETELLMSMYEKGLPIYEENTMSSEVR
jgi:hypothetical protein